MINNVVLVGRLTRDPELRYTSSGQAVATFSLAVSRNFTNASGERETDFINCVIWRKPAETLANYARKGSLLGVTGRMQTRSYENQQGIKVYVTEVVAENFQLLESKAVSEQRQQQMGGGYDANQGQPPMNNTYNNASNNYNSFDTNSSAAPKNEMPDFGRDQSPFENKSNANSPFDISDDDLPF